MGEGGAVVKTPNAPVISVIVPVHNGGRNLHRCLAALAETEPPPDEIIVVLDGDTDGSGQIAEESGAQVIGLPSRGGPARARNLGALAAQGDVLLFVDADVLVRPDTIGQIKGVFEQERDWTAVFGSYDDEPAASNLLSQYKNLFHHYVHQMANEEASTFWAGCGAIRRDAFLAVEGFDESYRWPAIEDIELGYRLKQAGHGIRLCKALQVKHLKRWDVISLLKADVLYRALPWTELILRDRLFINDLNLRVSRRVSVMLAYGILSSLIGAWWWPGSLVFAGVAVLLLFALNIGLYRFFFRQRGLWFALQTIPWHWFYYLYSGLAFAIGVARYSLKRRDLFTSGFQDAGKQV